MLRDMFYRIQFENLLLGLVFVLLLAATMTLLGRSKRFRNNQAMKTVLSLCFSLLLIYGIARSNVNLENIFYNVGFSQGGLYKIILVLMVVFIAGIGLVKNHYGHWKWRLYRILIIVPGVLIILTFFENLIYAKGMIVFIGIPMLAVGLILWWRRRRGFISYKKTNAGRKEIIRYEAKQRGKHTR
jgi:hypothetical protein